MLARTDNLGFLLNKAARMIKWEFDKKLKEFDLTTPQWSVLIDLALQKDQGETTISPAAVAERLNMDRPTISGVIERLGKKGMISTAENPGDRRYQILKITPDAEKLIPRLENLSNEVLQKAILGLQEEEQQNLKRYLNRVITNLTEF